MIAADVLRDERRLAAGKLPENTQSLKPKLAAETGIGVPQNDNQSDNQSDTQSDSGIQNPGIRWAPALPLIQFSNRPTAARTGSSSGTSTKNPFLALGASVRTEPACLACRYERIACLVVVF